MNPESLFVLIVVGCVGYPILLGFYRRREGIRHGLRRLVLVELAYLGVTFLVVEGGRAPAEGLLAGLLAALIVDRFIPKRSRYIRGVERRMAIARFELKAGEKYDPRRHDLHHEVAFKRGGSNTADNLRVLPRGENRSRGARSPWWDLLGRRR